jgi:hypothetical protein
MTARSFALFAGLLLLGGCIDPIEPVLVEDPPIETVEFDAALGIDLSEFLERSSGIWVRDELPGEGSGVEYGQLININYTGWVWSGFRFDHVDPSTGGPVPLFLGDERIIEGLNLGIQGMRVGGERTILVPPSLGFGAGSLPGIPGNSWLVIWVQLVSVDETGTAVAEADLP